MRPQRTCGRRDPVGVFVVVEGEFGGALGEEAGSQDEPNRAGEEVFRLHGRAPVAGELDGRCVAARGRRFDSTGKAVLHVVGRRD